MSRTASLDNYTSVPLEPVGGDDCYELLWFRNVFTAFAQKPVFLGRLEKGVRTVFAEWALDPDMAEIPGGKTGLIVRDFKGKDAVTPVYKVDTAPCATSRARSDEPSIHRHGSETPRRRLRISR